LFAKTVFSKLPQELPLVALVQQEKISFCFQGFPLPSGLQFTAPQQNQFSKTKKIGIFAKKYNKNL